MNKKVRKKNTKLLVLKAIVMALKCENFQHERITARRNCDLSYRPFIV